MPKGGTPVKKNEVPTLGKVQTDETDRAMMKGHVMYE